MSAVVIDTLPHDTQAELITVGCLALDPHTVLPLIRSIVTPDMYWDADLAQLHSVLVTLVDAGRPVHDGPWLTAELRRTVSSATVARLMGIMRDLPNAAHAVYHAEHVREHADARSITIDADEARRLALAGNAAGAMEIFAKQRSTKQTNLGGSFAAMAKKEINQTLNPIVIDSIVREGETINIVSDSKVGKTWFVHGLAICKAVGAEWLGIPLEQGRVLLLDNELHEPTLVSRIRQIARALQIDEAEFSDQLDVECFRGRLIDIHAVVAMLKRIPKGKYKVVILDSLYRFAPEGFDENSNTDTTSHGPRTSSSLGHDVCEFRG